MAIEYEVVQNNLTDPPSYSLRVRVKGTISARALIRRIVAISTVSTADAEAVLTALAEVIAEELSNGNSVVIGDIVQLTPALRAKLNGPTDPLPADTKLNISARVIRRLLNNVRLNATFARVSSQNMSPSLATVEAVTGSLTSLAAGNVVEIKGERLKFNPAKPDEGVFFVNPADSPIRVTTYLDNGDKRIRFAVPNDLASTFEYTLEVRKRTRGSKALRSGSWDTSVTAA